MKFLAGLILLASTLAALPNAALTGLLAAETQAGGSVTNVTRGLVGWWKMDDGSGTTATDSSGSGNNGVLHGGSSWTTGTINGAIDFDGVNGYTTNAQSSLPTGTTTVSLWIKPDAVDSDTIIMHHFVSGSQNTAFTIGQDDAGSGRFGVTLGGGIDKWLQVALTQGAWSHVVVLISDSSVDAVYINNVAQTNLFGDTGFTAPILDPSGFSTTLGQRGLVGTAYWNGSLDDVRLYNVALDTGEIDMLYQGGGEL